jgi:hypothetical protein
MNRRDLIQRTAASFLALFGWRAAKASVPKLPTAQKEFERRLKENLGNLLSSASGVYTETTLQDADGRPTRRADLQATVVVYSKYDGRLARRLRDELLWPATVASLWPDGSGVFRLLPQHVSIAHYHGVIKLDWSAQVKEYV